MTFAVVVDDHSVEVSSFGGPVAGKIHLLLGGKVFPDAVWWDFPCVVLAWWLLAARSDDSFELRFMDGPAAVRCDRDGSDLILTGVIESRSDERWRGTAVRVPRSQVIEELERAATDTLATCRRLGVPAAELESVLSNENPES